MRFSHVFALCVATALTAIPDCLADDEPAVFVDWFEGVCGLEDGTIFKINGKDGEWIRREWEKSTTDLISYKKPPAGLALDDGQNFGTLHGIRYTEFDAVKGKWCIGDISVADCSDIAGRFEFLLIGAAPFQSGMPISSGGFFAILGMRMASKAARPVMTVGKCFPESSAPGQYLLHAMANSTAVANER
mmetsp:Transcript_11119/g.41543  ORF Transcript_11119/g.41543 Transcript_11119/m.41543 type:complete len:189 (-) Transcript_11119:29-595(-)